MINQVVNYFLLAMFALSCATNPLAPGSGPIIGTNHPSERNLASDKNNENYRPPTKYDTNYFTDADELTGAIDPACEGIPPVINIKTPSRSFNALFYIALNSDGRICVKPIKPFGQYKNGWQLLNGNGEVFDPEEDHFDRPNKIIALQADADEVIAMSDDLRLYFLRWMKNPKFPGKPGRWNDLLGWPLYEAYYVGKRVWGDNKGKEQFLKRPDLINWGIGRRNQIVKYFEDAAGHQHDGGGGLTSYYFVSPDRSEIYYSDSGLPSDQSHTMCTPRRGRFAIEGFDVSASTMFVINAKGEMYTRMADFDTIGSDVMFFKYSYHHDVTDPNTFVIPAEDWLKQPEIKLEGKAKISSLVTIALTGPGNGGRELRVAGSNSNGELGYYYKNIFALNTANSFWKFQKDPKIKIPAERWTDPNNNTNTDLPSKEQNLEGTLTISDSKGDVELPIKLHQYNLYCSPAKLEITYKGATFHAKLHLVEEWFHLKRFAPGSDGTPYYTMGTLQFEDEQHYSLPKALHSLHLKEFSFWGEGNSIYLKLSSREEIKPRITMNLIKHGSEFPDMKSAERYTNVTNGYTLMANDPILKVPSANLELHSETNQLKELVKLNQQVLEKMTKLHKQIDIDDQKTPFYITKKGFVAANVLFTILRWHEKINTISTNVGVLVQKNEEIKKTMDFSQQIDFDYAHDLIKNRIKAYKKRIQDIQNKAKSEWVWIENEKEFLAKFFHFGTKTATHPWKGCQVLAMDNSNSVLTEFIITCGQTKARYQMTMPGLRPYFLENAVGQEFDFSAVLFLREKSPQFPYSLPLEVEGQFKLKNSHYSFKSKGFSVEW